MSEKIKSMKDYLQFYLLEYYRYYNMKNKLESQHTDLIGTITIPCSFN